MRSTAASLFCLFMVVLPAMFVPGCIPIVVERADTIVSLESPSVRDSEDEAHDASIVMGLKYSSYCQIEDQSYLVATGLFPDEERTWVWWHLIGSIAHPYPDFDRFIRITWPAEHDRSGLVMSRIDMILDKGWRERQGTREYEAYSGKAMLAFHYSEEKVSTELHHVKLTRVGKDGDVLILSGVVSGYMPGHSALRSAGAGVVEEFERKWICTVPDTLDEQEN